MQLTVSNLSKSYGVHTVLDSVGLTLGTGQRIGLVGANGVGKSTLLKCLIGEIEADSAAITLTRAARIGYLAQTMDGFGGATLGDVIEAAIAPIRALEQRLRQLEGEMALRPAALSTILDSYAECLEAYEWAGGHDLAYRIERVLSGLGVAHLPRQRLVETCSGGEKARVRLAMLLLGSPDMLLLDEPTNHLDALSLAWLERYLAASHSAMLIVSHDRHFLNQTVNAILEIDEHTHALKRYSGNYDAYLEAKRLERARWLEDYARQEEQIKELRHAIKVEARQVAHNRPPKDGDKLVYNGKKANVESTIARRVHNAEERLRRIEADPVPKPPDPLIFDADFDPAAFAGQFPLIVSGVEKAFGGRCILRHVSFVVGTQARILIIGENGVGKSTLLRILAGVMPPDRGSITRHPQTRLGYLDQECESLSPTLTLFDAYRAGLLGTEQQHKAVLLSSGLFRYADLDKRIAALSSGQKRKVQIARTIAERANLLLVDEPTNYISFDVLESFEAALRTFPGAVIAVSHDRRFREAFAGEVWELREGALHTLS